MTPPRGPIKHGTNSGYMTHRNRGDIPCDACVEAHNETNRTQYARSPDMARTYGRAESKALYKLRQRHPEEYKKIFDEILRAERQQAYPL